MKAFYQLFSLAITSLAITYFKTPCKRNNESQSKAGDGELHSRGRMHGPGDNGWGGVLAEGWELPVVDGKQRLWRNLLGSFEYFRVL